MDTRLSRHWSVVCGTGTPPNPHFSTFPSLILTPRGGGKVLIEWPYSTRMGGTRLQKKVVGVDLDFMSAGTSDGLEKTLSGFTAGQVVEVRLIAYNDGGDAAPSPVADVTVT